MQRILMGNQNYRYLRATIERYQRKALSIGKPTYRPTDPLKIPDLIDLFIQKYIY